MKKKMYRAVTALLALLLCAALVGCGNVPQAPVDSENNNSETENGDNASEISSLDIPSEATTKEDDSDSIADEADDGHVELPMQFYFHDFQELAELRNAQKSGDDAVRKLFVEGVTSLECAEDVEWIFQEIGNAPIPLLTGGDMEPGVMTYTPTAQTIEISYVDEKTGKFIRFSSCFGETLEELLSGDYADAELLEIKDCGGYSIRFYKNPQERVTDDIWWTIGVFDANGTRMELMFGCDPTYGGVKDPNITLDELFAPLEHLTITTILEQIGE